MPKGEFAAKELIRKRKRYRMLKKWWKRKFFHLKAKHDPVGTVPMAKALVLQKFVLLYEVYSPVVWDICANSLAVLY